MSRRRTRVVISMPELLVVVGAGFEGSPGNLPGDFRILYSGCCFTSVSGFRHLAAGVVLERCDWDSEVPTRRLIVRNFSGVKQEVSQTKQELATTRSELQRELQRMIGDLGVQSDLIAHNRTELGELRQLGAREYFKFDLRKNKNPVRFGPVSLHLRKTDVKRQKYTLHLIADDRTIEKKDKTANEPVQFYQDGFRLPTEIVVHRIYKDRIVGYVSVPRQREGRTAQTALRGWPPPKPF